MNPTEEPLPLDVAVARRRYLNNNLTKVHGIVWAVIFFAFTALNFFITNAGVDQGPEHSARVWRTTLGTITGPLTGAISRDFQSCCLEMSLMIAAVCGPILAVAVAVQFVGSSRGGWARAGRMAAWVFGWLIWFGGGILSFGHALS